ncbi:MAG: NFACT family protein [Candidatus Aenigmarchaeota archaeon]|nr:NFACT family protein [Candidatus Aenigmarchaeota archaeon]
MTSLELKHLIDELGFLNGSRIDKIYHCGRELRIKLYALQKGTCTLLAAPGRLYLTEKKGEMPEATNFAMVLRKYLTGKRLESLQQYKFDRIVEMKIGRHILISEFFHKGNHILCDSSYMIIMPMVSQKWKDREILPRKKYIFPFSCDIRESGIFNMLKTEQKIEGLLHTNGFGSYAKEILQSSNVPNKPCSELSDEEAERVYAAIQELLKRRREPKVVYEKGNLVDAIPFDISIYKEHEKQRFETFSQALDVYFENEKQKKDPVKEKAKVIIKKQEEAIEKFREEEKLLERKIMLLNNNYAHVDMLLNSVLSAKKSRKTDASEMRQFSEIQKPADEYTIDMRRGVISLTIEGQLIELKFNEPLSKALNGMYERLKKIRRKKISAAKHAGKMTERTEKKERIEEKKMWYHKYRYFTTSDGFLVVAGKDERTNEDLIKKHVMPSDIILHAEITGAPFTVIKADKEVSEQAIKEAATFAACFSKAWAMGLGSVDVYWIKPEQVSKSAPSGEHIGKGAFMIHGKKNYIKNVRLGLCVGITENGKIIVSPKDAAIKHAKYYVALCPGNEHDLGKKIKRRFETMSSAVMKECIKKIKPGEMVSRIPSGRGEILQ